MQFLYRRGIVLGTAELKMNDPRGLGQEIHIQSEMVDMWTDKYTDGNRGILVERVINPFMK